MKRFGTEFLAPVLVSVGLVGAAVSFALEARSFRDVLLDWATRDLAPRTAMAATTLKEPLATGDFRRIHAFGDQCAAEGIRFTVFSAPGGLVFDSARDAGNFPQAIYVSRPCGDFTVRLGLPIDRAMAPFRRARLGFFLAAAVGGAGVLLVFLFTYRQRMRLEEMRKLERFRREFIADVSHELKTPLTGILGAVELLGEGKLQDMIRKESVRLNDLVQGILSLSRLERDGSRETLRRTVFDLTGLACETVERFARQAEKAGAELRLADSVAPVPVDGDATLVAQAVDNLVANAVRHSGAKRIEVSVSAQAGRAEVRVDDDGVGIPPDERPRIFERFHRVDASRTAATGGSGLGLAIAQRILRLHGGDVALVGKDGPGCRFVAHLPQGKTGSFSPAAR